MRWLYWEWKREVVHEDFATLSRLTWLLSEVKPDDDRLHSLFEWNIVDQVFTALYALGKENVAGCGNGDDMGVFAERFEGNGIMNLSRGLLAGVV